jgi:glycosyltransferase involved in cell wall biosynthesis
MSLGLPTVTTSIGLEGFEAKNGVHLSVADNPTKFAAEVLRLLDDRVAARIMAENGRHYVEVNHSWNSILQPMVEIIRSA